MSGGHQPGAGETGRAGEAGRPGGGPAPAGPAAGAAPARYTVLYAEPLPQDLQAVVRAVAPPWCELLVAPASKGDRATFLAALQRADFLVVATARVDADLLREAPRLKHVQHQGVGYDNIDLAACRAAGVSVALTPEGTTTGVAEHTLLLILALYRRLREAESALRAGGWPVWALRSRSFELAGKHLGLVGFGRIGRAVARRAAAFEAAVSYYDPQRATPEEERALGVRYSALDDLLGEADVVSLHLPLSPATRGLIGERELGLMRPQAILINTARGALVDEAALTRALQEGRLAGAGLDVFESEPPLAHNPLLTLQNVVLTPHIAAGTIDAFRTKMRAVFEAIQRVAAGGEAPHRI